MKRLRSLSALALAVGVVLGATGCTAQTAPSTTSSSKLSGAITVFAAASLTATFQRLAKNFQDEHPAVTVSLSFAGSADLASQIVNGAPADVFASADTATMKTVTDAHLAVGKPVEFATNVLEIAVPPGNPASIKSFADLARPGVKTVVCAPQVPCGAATVAVERLAGVKLSPVSEETDVTDVLGKVSSGEADAGLVYVTDVKGAGSSVEGITFAESRKVVNSYPIAEIAGSHASAAAAAFIAYVTGPVGRKVLAAAGFGAP